MAVLGDASDTMMAHPLALQLRNLQSLVEIGVDKNTTVVFPAPLMSTISELGAFLEHESKAASDLPATPTPPTRSPLSRVMMPWDWIGIVMIQGARCRRLRRVCHRHNADIVESGHDGPRSRPFRAGG